MHITHKADAFFHRVFDVTFPQIQHIPTHSLQFGSFPLIPFFIERELPSPELGVRSRQRQIATFTSVPVTTEYEHR